MQDENGLRALLEALEGALADAAPEEIWAQLAYLAGQNVQLDETERDSAVRRALFLLAAGGDPRRTLDLDGRAVTALAVELGTCDRRRELAAAIRALRLEAGGLPRTEATLVRLETESELAWRAYACALLAEELDV